MSKIISISTLGIAGAVAAGVMAFQIPTAVADDGDAFKRTEELPDVVMTVDDDDDDDTYGREKATNTNTRDTRSVATRSRDTGDSRSRADNTNSRVTAVSRDRDRSRGDLTKDWTRDGGTKTRDRSANHTNDKSRNDTRRR